MKKSLQIGSAFIGVIVGAGFASGQEILQFFSSFGYVGIAGSIVASLLFAFLGMNLVQLGSRLQTTSHKDVIYHICGRYLGMFVDFIITFFLFGVTVVMFSGSGAIFEEQFGLPMLLGSLLMAILTILSVTLNIKKVIGLISAVTPFLLVIVLVIAGYSFIHFDPLSIHMDAAIAKTSPAASNWIMGSLLYVSYNIAAGAAMITVMGGTIKDKKVAAWGGIIGGLGLGLLILLINFSLLTQIDSIADVAMPMITLANGMHPIVSVFMAIILIGMIYNTAVAMLYAFSARVVKPTQPSFKVFTVLFGILAFGASFVGFVNLVGTVYPLMGYLGFTLIAAIIYSWFVRGKRSTQVS
ncbi:hypothetical protein [Psychrobacillus vulpis]|uniref:Transporter n=1 Tax=Psychrobacillus vulpis TaxID=2325572 RepID=A0A544TV52_9BACI|nr:hypothetical protein [Psychrobacillus vulpis]TQR21322.1 hypothetical protein FG384_03720 [Psychrobacillus vulpis]